MAGVTWQLAVSVHVLVKSRVGHLPFTTVVPEGLEDLDCRTAAGDETLVQVKEVSAGAGRLPTSRICEAIVHAMRATTGPIVIATDGELGSGLGFTGWAEPLAAQPRRCGALVDALIRQGVAPDDAVAVLERVHLVSLPWNLREQTEALLSSGLGTHPAVASFTVGALYEALGSAAADQRHLTLDQSRMLSIGDVDTALDAVQSAVDVTGLDAAVAASVCRPADFSATGAMSASQFYQGVDGAPAHVTQGLDVIRAKEMDQVTQAVQSERYALIVGPSGSGKSVLLWRAARDVILGARVVRVARVATDEDAQLLVRHVEMLRPTSTSPVVVAADNLGRPRTSAWPDAVDALREIAHVFIVGAAREEDFSPRLLRASTRVIRPLLDRLTADLIAERVERADLTVKMATAEAFKRSDGLLMEFLSLLREGEHLEQVLAVQAADLAAPGREVQREAARLVLSAHAVGLSLTSRMLAGALADIAGSTSAVGDALAVLKSEHVVLENGEVWTGLHELRSQTLTALLHEAPPPALGDTLSTVARQLPADEAGWLLRRAGERFPDTVIAVADAVAGHTRAPDMTTTQVAELLEGAERADNAAYAATCVPIIRGLLPRGLSPVVIAPFVYAIRNQGTVMGPIGTPAFDRSAEQLTLIAQKLPPRTSPVLEAAAKQLDPDRVVQLATRGSLAAGARLLEALAGTVTLSPPDAAAIFRAFDEPRDPSEADAWSRLIEAVEAFIPAHDRDDVFGTLEHRATVIAKSEPSAVEVTIQEGTGPSVTVMRELDTQQRSADMAWDSPSPGSRDALNDFVVALARQLTCACPEASHVEVVTITPSGQRFRIGGHEPGFKHMARDAFPDRVGVRRNVGFQGAVRLLSAAPTWTGLLGEQAKIARDLAALVTDAPFRLRANDPPSAASDWAARVQTIVQQSGELASRPNDKSEARALSHAREDGVRREDDPVSGALSAAAQALSIFATNDNHVAAAMAIRDAVAKLELARSIAPRVSGLDQPIPDTLTPKLDRLARAAISATATPAAWAAVRFGDQDRVDSIVASAAAEASRAQRSVLAAIEAAIPSASLRAVPDPRPFPSSIDQTAWLLTVNLEDWDSAVQALEGLDAAARQALACNVWALAVDGTVPLPMAVLMAHYGDQPVLPLAGESLEEHLGAAGLTLPQPVGAATDNVRDLTEQTVGASWAIALHQRRPAAWPRTAPAPTAADLDGIRRELGAAAAQLPAPVGPAVEAALEVLISQVELELGGTSALTLAGELLDVVDQGPTVAAVDAGLWQALTTLSLVPVLGVDGASVAPSE